VKTDRGWTKWGVTLKRQRIAGLMLCRDRSGREPWPMPDQPDSTHLSRKVKEAIRAAGLRDELSFTSFRHGGLTEGGDAELTDRERCWRMGGTPRSRCLPKYTKRTMRQAVTGAKKRRASRAEGGQLSE
jgi:hypothetical protein